MSYQINLFDFKIDAAAAALFHFDIIGVFMFIIRYSKCSFNIITWVRFFPVWKCVFNYCIEMTWFSALCKHLFLFTCDANLFGE